MGEAQEGSRMGCCQEKEQEDPEVPESRCWSHPPGHHGQEEPEARGEEGPERAGRQSRQGAEEADCFQEAPSAVDKKAKKAQDKAVKNVQKSAPRIGGKRSLTSLAILFCKTDYVFN